MNRREQVLSVFDDPFSTDDDDDFEVQEELAVDNDLDEKLLNTLVLSYLIIV